LFVGVYCPFKALINNTSVYITLCGARKTAVKTDCFIPQCESEWSGWRLSNQFPRFRSNNILPSKRPSRIPLDQGWRPILKARVQIVYKLQNKFFRAPMGILKSKERDRSLPQLLLIVGLLLMRIIVTLFN